MHIFVRACILFDLNLKQSQLCVFLIVGMSFLRASLLLRGEKCKCANSGQSGFWHNSPSSLESSSVVKKKKKKCRPETSACAKEGALGEP